jgi:hypothetical protein
LRIWTTTIGWPIALLFGRAYDAWCTRRMATDAVAALADVTAHETLAAGVDQVQRTMILMLRKSAI